MNSSFREDDWSAEEQEEMTWVGDTAYCGVGQHEDWAENVHGYCEITTPELISCCEDCGDRLAGFLVSAAVRGEAQPTELAGRVALRLENGDYEPYLAAQIQVELATLLGVPPALDAAEARALRKRISTTAEWHAASKRVAK